MKKTCSKCKNEKDISCFRKRKDGSYRYWCKHCLDAASAKYAANNRERIHEIQRNWRMNNKERANEFCKNYRLRYPYKIKAHNAITKALYRGEIKRAEKCEICNKKTMTQGHHANYKKPLVVIWCCRWCHENIHKTKRRSYYETPQRNAGRNAARRS